MEESEDDNVAPPDISRKDFQKLKSLNKDVRFLVLPGQGHNMLLTQGVISTINEGLNK